ncbi:MAG: tetratricopeptide repeat protein [Acidobacteria bacterium]|nr:tetratricopeptide repeat protein [Acidobacteriota bacterium]MYJ06272.1 tetratricopeptide repeat protein [Acidobacteriota bacterium]
MKRRVAATASRLIGVFLGLVVVGCAASDAPNRSGGSAAPGPTPVDPSALAPIALPDLSRLGESAAEEARARYDVVQAALEGGAPDAEVATAYGAFGLILMAAEYFEAAAESFRHAEVMAPRDPRWPYYLAHLHRMTEDRDAATAAFERALALRPSDVPTLIWLGRARLDQGQADLAERQFRQAAAYDPGSAAALAGAGRAALARGNFLDAAQYLEEALAIAPAASRLHYPLAMAYRGLGETDLAEAHLARRGGANPPLADPLMEELDALLPSAMKLEGQGIQALQSGRLADAVRAFRRGLELEPDNVSLRQRLATALAAGGETSAAVEQLEEALRRSPEFARAHFSLGAILALQGRQREAVEHYETALRLQPGYVEARMGLAEALRGAGRLADSLPHYARVTELDPGFAEAWFGRADALIRLGRLEEARAWLAEARSIHPERPELARLETAVNGSGR